MQNFEVLRQHVSEYQLASRGLHDQTVLNAVNAIPHEEFELPGLVEFTNNRSPLSIATRRMVSQPYVVALMTAALELKPGDRVLEVGTGSGYKTAVLAEIAKHVYTIESNKILADSARHRLKRLGYNNTLVFDGDGLLGLPKYAPFDAIVVAAGSPEIPITLKQQLAIGGCLVIPVGSTPHTQKLFRVSRISEMEYQEENLGCLHFSINSTAFDVGQKIPCRYTCDDQDISPPLQWGGLPDGTKSLALIMDDPDAPDPLAPKKTWTHWVLYNLPADSGGIPEAVLDNELPSGTRQGINSWGSHWLWWTLLADWAASLFF